MSNQLLRRVLAARDERSNLRKTFAASKRISVSLSLNIPGFPKSHRQLELFFQILIKDLLRYLEAHRVQPAVTEAVTRQDDAGDFFIVSVSSPLSAQQIKTLCETFESEYAGPASRVIDVDVCNPDGEPVTSGKAKACFICPDSSALACMRLQRHSHQQLRSTVFEAVAQTITAHKQRNLTDNLAALALRAVLYEISLSPKPGAVDRMSNGSHTDMDYFTFLNSSAAISVHFRDQVAAGIFFKGDAARALPIIRNTGLRMEERMYADTDGVNTQKGIIFLISLTLFTAAALINETGSFDTRQFIQRLKEYAGPLTTKELEQPLPHSATHGEICARKYGLKPGGGIRYEVEQGLPTVFNHGLPVLEKELQETTQLHREEHIKTPLLRTLLALMSAGEDTTILYRGGPHRLAQVKQMAREALEAESGELMEQKYNQLIDYCISEKISPGGAADLLAVTLLLYWIRKEYNGI